MKKQFKFIITFSLMFILLTIITTAHPGSLDENGGHYNRKTGEYHYHEGIHTEGTGSNSNNTYTNQNFQKENTSTRNLEDDVQKQIQKDIENAKKHQPTITKSSSRNEESLVKKVFRVIGRIILIPLILFATVAILYEIGVLIYLIIGFLYEIVKELFRFIFNK